MQNLNILTKKYGLVAGCLLLFLIGYQLAFKKTIEAWQLNSKLNKEIITASNLTYQPGYLERKSVNLDQILKGYKVDSTLFRSNVINTIALIAEKANAKMVQVPSPDPFLHTDRFIIQKLNFQGDYFVLIRLLQKLEATHDIGVVRTAVFHDTNDRKNVREGQLSLDVFLEISL